MFASPTHTHTHTHTHTQMPNYKKWPEHKFSFCSGKFVQSHYAFSIHYFHVITVIYFIPESDIIIFNIHNLISIRVKKKTTFYMRSWGSSVSIVSDYRLDDRFDPREPKDFFSSLCVQTGYGAHPASEPMGRGGRESMTRAWSWPLSLRSRMSRSLLLSPLLPIWQ
jgi:hypothetical protein